MLFRRSVSRYNETDGEIIREVLFIFLFKFSTKRNQMNFEFVQLCENEIQI